MSTVPTRPILFLGAAHAQLPAIHAAKRRGLYVITADNRPENPGHQLAEEYHPISSTDHEAILALSRRLGISAVSAYASDPAAMTAAYVSEELGLIGGGFEAVRTLSDKARFRAFLQAHGFPAPWFVCGTSLEEVASAYPGGRAVMKPVDSSGSKGVGYVLGQSDLPGAFERAVSHSRSGRIILEEFIQRKGPQIHGEGFVLAGRLIFLMLGDQVFSPVSPLVPYSTTFPSHAHADVMHQAHALVADIVTKAGLHTGGINVEIIRSEDDRLFVVEIGARNGGNFMPQLAQHATGFDLALANVEALIDAPVTPGSGLAPSTFFTQVILHAHTSGTYTGLNIPAEFQDGLRDSCVYLTPGMPVERYRNSRDVVGVLIFEVGDNDRRRAFAQYLDQNDWVGVSA